MHVKDVENLLLTASCQHFLVPRDPSEFVVEIEVSIDRYDGNQEQTVQMGGASLFLIDEQRVLDYGESLLEVMDAHSQELTDVYSALFDTEGDYREEFEEQDFLGRSLLYIDFGMRERAASEPARPPTYPGGRAPKYPCGSASRGTRTSKKHTRPTS
jgi:hypothetical protein